MKDKKKILPVQYMRYENHQTMDTSFPIQVFLRFRNMSKWEASYQNERIERGH